MWFEARGQRQERGKMDDRCAWVREEQTALPFGFRFEVGGKGEGRRAKGKDRSRRGKRRCRLAIGRRLEAVGQGKDEGRRKRQKSEIRCRENPEIGARLNSLRFFLAEI